MVVAAVELFIDPGLGTVIESDRATVSDWMVVLDPVRGIGIYSDRVVAMDSEVAVATDSSRENSAQAGIDSDPLAAMDSVTQSLRCGGGNGLGPGSGGRLRDSDWTAAIDSVAVKKDTAVITRCWWRRI